MHHDLRAYAWCVWKQTLTEAFQLGGLCFVVTDGAAFPLLDPYRTSNPGAVPHPFIDAKAISCCHVLFFKCITELYRHGLPTTERVERG